ncbi:MAG: circadian clock KaiB family protein [Candidatus Latescibacterota bacterium]
MNSKKVTESTAEFEAALAKPKQEKYVLRLYITGSTPRSAQAIRNLKIICEERLKGRYELEVIDIYQQPNRAKDDHILAAPTLIKRLPSPLRKIIGDLSDTEHVLVGLGLEPSSGRSKSKP